ncbi:DHH family phosphoesterase [Helicobacter pylori]|uniref:DHH family phosphoesterase n=1 Tax=Helicobacter pylori TaxID=210 RepID=UPI0004198EF7|nr:DHH family phosphoesterase [Helicobacter pylori]
MPKKELLKMSKKRIFKNFLEEVKQHRPIVFYTDNDCDGMLAGSVLMSMCYRLGIKDFFFFSPLRNAHGYGFTDLALNDLLSQPCIFNPKTNQLVRLDYIKKPISKNPPLSFSADLGADLAANTKLQEILLERFEQCIITDHHKSFEVDWIDKNKIAYINLNDEKDANYYSGAFTSALVLNQIFQTQTTPLENELIAITLLSDRIDLDHGDNLDMVLDLASVKHERIQCFFKDKDLSLAQDDLDGISNLYDFNCINYINALSRLSGAREFKGCYDSYLHYLVLKHFNPISDPRLSAFNVKEFKRYNDIKKKMVKESEENAQIFSCNKILVTLLDESCSIKVGVSGLVANNFLKKYPSNRSLCIYRDNKDGYSGSARGNFLSQIKTIPLIQSGGHEEAFGLSFAKEDFKKVIKSLQAL